MKTIIKSLDQISLSQKRVFLRTDFNVPLDNGRVQDVYRIQAAFPTIQYLIEKNAKIIIGTHLGRPQGTFEKEWSLEPVAEYLSQQLSCDVILIDEPDGDAPKALFSSLKRNQILMLENLRFLKGEVENSEPLASHWASYIDVYVNDAFGVIHRNHCSLNALPKLIEERTYGFLVDQEIRNLTRVIENPLAPFGLVLGGAKVSDKIQMIERLADQVDVFLIGGAMAYTFLKAQGINVGASKIEKDKITFARNLLQRLEQKNKKVLLPVDHVVSKDFQGDSGRTQTFKIAQGQMALDIGPQTVKLFCQEIKAMKTILWNGPMGVFENPVFSQGTQAICQEISNHSGFTVVGGGDSAFAAQKFGGSFSHVSTGGGATLEFLEGKDLPGLTALRLSRKEIAGLQRIEWVSEAIEEEKNIMDFIYAANWKMNLSLAEAKEYIMEFQSQITLSELRFFRFFPQALQSHLFAHSQIPYWGAQNIYCEDFGAFTGENSLVTYKEMGASTVLVGHSERRILFQESNEQVHRKVQAADKHGFEVILCVGETYEQRLQGQTLEVLKTQLQGFSRGEFKNLMIAYEPVWAIGTGSVAQESDVQEAHSYIKELLGISTCVLYGGSVKPSNALTLANLESVNGFLVGGASLKVDSFLEIFKQTWQVKKR